MAGKGNAANLRPPWQPGQSGNPAGSSRKRRVLVACGYGGFDGDALAFLTKVFQDHRLPLLVRLEAASRVARFQHPTLSASLTANLQPEPGAQVRLEPAERRQRVAALLRQAGLPAPVAPG